jgi:hypothetical protein
MRPHLLAALALASFSAASLAQADARVSPPALVADSFFRATASERWHDAVHFLDLDALVQLRDEQVRSYRRRRARVPMTVDDLLKYDPNMPREVAEYQVKQVNEGANDTDFLPYEFARVASIDSLAALPPVEVAARWLEARGMRWQMHRSLELQRKRGCEFPDSLEAAMFARPAMVRILGAVIEDSTAWVLHDEPEFGSGDDRSPGIARARSGRVRPILWAIPPRITTLHLVRGAWRVMPALTEGGMSFTTDCPRVQRTLPPAK